ncbi:MAG TPA: hypothetical protein ENN07_05945 [candidate division Zixibacteria bacterium]|nr:hypothetical protein [candidate division Zixibacteria bacterium]
MEFNAKLTVLACTVLLVAGAVFAQPSTPLCANLSRAPYGLVGDTLEGDVILAGFVRGHSAYLELESECVRPGLQYRFFRTPLGSDTPDFQTGWIPLSSVDIDGGGDGQVFKYSAAVTDGDTVVYSNPLGYPDEDIYVMHDWYRPDRIEGISTYYYADPARIRINWRKGTDSASGVYKYYIYRAPSGLGYTLEYIDPAMVPVDSVLDDGRMWYDWSDYDVTPDDCFWYVIVPMDKAGWVRRTGNDPFRRCASGTEPHWPPCAQLREIPRYHHGGGLTIRIDLDRCPGTAGEVVQYRYRKYRVFTDPDTEESDMYLVEETPWTDASSYFFSTIECSTYTFSAQARYLGGPTSPWSHLIPTYPLTTNDQTPPGCPEEMTATSRGEDGIYIHFYQNPNDDCGSGILGYHLFRFSADSIAYFLPPDSSLIEDYRIHHYIVNSTGHYYYEDDGPSDPIIDLRDGQTYYYVVSPYDSAGYTNWLDCGDSQIDTATVDKGVFPPIAVRLPSHSCGGTVHLDIIDTTYCDAIEVEVQWSADPFFGGASFVGIGPIPIHSDTTIGGVFTMTNPDDGICTNWDTLKMTITDLYETQWFFRARFRDSFENISEWSNVVVTRVDNTPPATTNITNIQSLADSVDRVNILLTWNNEAFTDGDGSGVDSVKIFRSTAIGESGTEIATVSKHVNKFIDTDPDPGNNWHDNVYRVVPFDYCGHHNYGGGQGSFSRVGQHPPAVPRIDTVLVSHYLDSFTVVWSDTGLSPLTTKYVLRHAGTVDWLWLGDELIAPNVNLGVVPSHRKTFPIEDLFGGSRHYFMMFAVDGETPGNESGWSEVFEFELPPALNATDTIELFAGWNLVSLPVIPANNTASVLFPGAHMFAEWNPEAGEYIEVNRLYPGRAYWVLMTSAVDYPMTGIPVMKVQENEIGRGWWTIGAPFDDSETREGSGFSWTGLGHATPYDWNGVHYNPTSRLMPGKGYWLLLTGTGDFYSESGMPKAISFDPVIDWNFFVDIDGVSLEVASSDFSDRGIDMADIVMPPTPPFGEISPAFIDEEGYRYIRKVRPDGEWTIDAPYGSILSWNPKALPSVELVLVTERGTIDMHESNSAEIFGRAKIVARGALPAEFNLGQNVPNPFNATCAVPFTVPKDEHVTITVYDISGNLVTTLVDDEITAGSHRVVWDGTDGAGRSVPSGIYLCRMTAGESFAATRRMLLVK